MLWPLRRHPRLGAIALLLLLLLSALPAGSSARAQDDGTTGDDTPVGDQPTDDPVVADPPPDDPSDDPPADDPQPDSPQPPPPPVCPAGLIVTDDGRCVDPAELERLLAGYEAAAQEEVEALQDLAEALDELAALEKELLAVEIQVGEVQLRVAAAAGAAVYADLRTGTAGENLADVQLAVDVEQQRLRRQAVDAYIGGAEEPLAAMGRVLDAESAGDLAASEQYATAVVEDQLATLDRVEVLREAVVELQVWIAELAEAAEVDAAAVVELETELFDLLAVQRDLVAAAEVESEAIAARIAEIQQKKAEYAAQLEVQAAGGGAIGALLRSQQAGQSPPPQPTGFFQPPLRPFTPGSPFGPRLHPIFGVTRMHTGLDAGAPAGRPLLAAADGVVVIARATGGYGNVVVIDHGNGLATLYAHQSAVAVHPGQRVVTGETIGFVGSTGWSTGPHLHFEVRVFGEPVDPYPYLDLTAANGG